MFITKYGKGVLPLGDLVRMDEGTTIIYEVSKGDGLKFEVLAQSYATRTNAVIKQTKLYAHDYAGNSFHLVKITVVKQGTKLKQRGRPKKLNKKP